MIISFGYTTPALLAGEKHQTMRDWSDKTIQTATRIFRDNGTLDAWNTSPRNKSIPAGKIATIRLTMEPKRVWTHDLPASAWQAEGFHYLRQDPDSAVFGLDVQDLWAKWRHPASSSYLTMVRFDVLEFTPFGEEIRARQRCSGMWSVGHGLLALCHGPAGHQSPHYPTPAGVRPAGPITMAIDEVATTEA